MSVIANLTADDSAEKSQRPWRVCTTIVAFGLTIWFLIAMNVGGSNIAISSTSYGFPLTFVRVYQLGPVIPLNMVLAHESILSQFFMRALVFNVVLAIVTVAAVTFSLHRLSATWTAGEHVAFYALSVAICFPLLVDVPSSIAWLFLLAYLLAIPFAFFCFTAYAVHCGAMRLLGNRLSWLGFLCVACSFVGFYYWTDRNDMYIDPDSEDAAALIEHFSSDDPRLRLLAIRAIKRLPAGDDSIVEPVLDLISDEDYLVRSEAVSVVTQLGTDSVQSVPALVEVLHDDDVGSLAAHALGEFGPAANAAVPALRNELQTAKGYETLSICKALWLIDGKASVVIPPLIELLEDDFGPIRRDAAEILGQIGPAAKAAVPTLVGMVQYSPPPQEDPPLVPSADVSGGEPIAVAMTDQEFYPQIRAAAAEALKKIDAQAATRAGVE
ncbi:HEAT repeat protein [Symmachiella macrocystis]|uniref:HEAT repeat protein n=1 Tax=Symmachiella macrocystis TaxID=2527985 RepID=A0A5C6BLW8_9PLAN|nr:HEAT repeat domain-containing protein [Symmachiella macrocystis]TWU12762.1 HEAT repeat protein [Symmachiella macrocystis]